MLADAKWRTVSWRTGTKGKLKARFAAVRVHTADGPPQRIRDKGQQHLPGDEAWLIGEHRASGEKKYYLANLPAATDLRSLAATIKARWICEQGHQQLKEDWPRPLRGRSARSSPSCANEDGRVRLPSISSPQKSEVEKKKSTDRRLNQACQPCVTPSSRSSLHCRLNVAHTAEGGFVQRRSVNKSAKVRARRRSHSFHHDAAAAAHGAAKSLDEACDRCIWLQPA